MSRADPEIYLIACEASGDALGARLMEALRERTGGRVRFAGVGGARMAEEGVNSLFDIAQLSVMGIIEVLPKAPLVLRLVRQVAADIAERKPDAVVLIDSWGFTGRVAKRLRRMPDAPPVIRYVAPQVWAWRPGRAKRLAGLVDRLMTLWAHEPPLFEVYGLPSVHVGHPVIEASGQAGDGVAFRSRHGIDRDARLLILLPGSRWAEIKALLPVFGETAQRLADRFPDLRVALPTVHPVDAEVERRVASWPVPVVVLRGETEKRDAFAAGNAALAASGTVTIELAVAGLPHVIAYKANRLSAFLFRRLTRLRFVNLVNILLDRPVIPEMLQDQCRAELLVQEVGRLLDDAEARRHQEQGFVALRGLLGQGGERPSLRAADVVLSLLGQNGKETDDAPAAHHDPGP